MATGKPATGARAILTPDEQREKPEGLIGPDWERCTCPECGQPAWRLLATETRHAAIACQCIGKLTAARAQDQKGAMPDSCQDNSPPEVNGR